MSLADEALTLMAVIRLKILRDRVSGIGHGSKESFKIHLILLLAIKACSPSACVVIYVDICFITCSTEKSCLNVSPLLLLIRCKKCARMCFHSKTLLLNTTSYLSNPIRSTCLIVCVDIGEPSSVEVEYTCLNPHSCYCFILHPSTFSKYSAWAVMYGL